MFRRYHKLSELGRGGMGVTFRAWDTKEDRVVVLKQPREDLLGKPGLLERFDREIRVVASLRHPHIVPITDRGVDDEGVPYFVMPYQSGGSLLIRVGRDQSKSRRLMRLSRFHYWLPTVASALNYAHDPANGTIIHRDVKPSNILFDAYWHARLSDFGVAQLMCDSTGESTSSDGLTQLGGVPGVLKYTAPERLPPKRDYDGRADQYSLAVMAYELACGEKPFQGKERHIVVEILHHEPPSLAVRYAALRLKSLPHLPDSFCAAIHRALAKSPEERFPSCSAFVAAALADVPRQPEDPDQVRMLCPAPDCETLIRFSHTRAGARLACPTCSCRFTVVHDLGYLEMPSDRRGDVTDPGINPLAGGSRNASGKLANLDLDVDSETDSGSLFLDLDPPTLPPQRIPRSPSWQMRRRKSEKPSPQAASKKVPDASTRPGDKDYRVLRGIMIGLAFTAMVLAGCVLWSWIADFGFPPRSPQSTTPMQVPVGKKSLSIPIPADWMLGPWQRAHVVKFIDDTQEVLAIVIDAKPNVNVPGTFSADDLKDVFRDIALKEFKPAVVKLPGMRDALKWECPATAPPIEPGSSPPYRPERIPKKKTCYGIVVDDLAYVIEAWPLNNDSSYVRKKWIWWSGRDALRAAEEVAGGMKHAEPMNVPSKLGQPFRNAFGMQFSPVKAGRYRKPIASIDSKSPPQVSIAVTRTFLIGTSPVTIGQWENVMREDLGQQRSATKDADAELTWEQALRFCEELTKREQVAGHLPQACRYSVPNEVEGQLGNDIAHAYPEWRVKGFSHRHVTTLEGIEYGVLHNRTTDKSKKGSLIVARFGDYEKDVGDLKAMPFGLTARCECSGTDKLKARVTSLDLNDPTLANCKDWPNLKVTWEAKLYPRYTGDYVFAGNCHGGTITVTIGRRKIIERKEPVDEFVGDKPVRLQAGTPVDLRIVYARGEPGTNVDLSWSVQGLLSAEPLPIEQLEP